MAMSCARMTRLVRAALSPKASSPLFEFRDSSVSQRRGSVPALDSLVPCSIRPTLFRSQSTQVGQGDTPIFGTVEEGNQTPTQMQGSSKPEPDILNLSPQPKVAPLPDDIPEIQEMDAAPEGKVRVRKKGAQAEEARSAVDDIPLPMFISSDKTGSSRGRPKKAETLSLAEAIKRVKAEAKAKFVETVEAHIRLSVDPKRSDQVVRGAATLPYGTGSVVRVAVFAEGELAEEARQAGADVVGADDLIASIKQSGGKLAFDKCVAVPALMPRLGQIARILGPRGLMPNPKLGTVTMNVEHAVKEAKRGRIDFRADKAAIVHGGVGKVSFADAHLQDNIAAFAAALLAAKPLGLKKSSRFIGYFNSVTLSSTMGPGFAVSVQSVANAADLFLKRSV